MTKTDFDAENAAPVSKVAAHVGQNSLHASVLGVQLLESIADELLTVLIDSNAFTAFCRIVKADLAVAKLVDVLLDSGENLAVPWHVYNARPLRLLNVITMTYLLDDDLLKGFWDALMESRKDAAWTKMLPVLNSILSRVDVLPDARSREIIGQAVRWAIENPEAIGFYSKSKALRNGHLPNMAAFPELLGSIEMKSQEWDQPVVEIKHDRQTQFGNMLKQWRAAFATATADPLVLPFGEKHVFRRVFGSKFTVSESSCSPGIDTVPNELTMGSSP